MARIKKLATASDAAKAMGVHKSTVSRRMKKLGMKESRRLGKARNGTQGLSSADRRIVARAGRKRRR